MAIQDQGNTRPVSAEVFQHQPYYREDFVEAGVASTTKGTDVMLGMLLDQYQNKPILQAYFAAFFEEMDNLFEQLDTVYLGRFLETAIGTQLDILGVIIDQSRQINLSGLFFGFVGAGEKMAASATPADGGIFKGAESEGFTNVPLNDIQYRRLLLAKSQVHNRHSITTNQMYSACSTLLGKTPRKMQLQIIGPRNLNLILSDDDTTADDEQLVQYLSQYIVPLGTTFTVSRIA